MANKKASKNTYQGLRPNFRLACETICRGLPQASWNGTKWKSLSFKSDNGLQSFPEQGTSIEKAAFLDEYLFSLLHPKRIDQYRGWLTHRILKQLKGKEAKNAYRLPEDIQNIIDDLVILNRRAKNLDINQRKTLNDFNEGIKPYRPDYPLNGEEKWIALACYLENPLHQLKEIFPDWDLQTAVYKKQIEEKQEALNQNSTPKQKFKLKTRKRNGAKIINQLPDGLLVIHLKDQNAARDLGSPKWCTAYREEITYFNNYKNDLLLLLEPETGERWQFHVGTGQFNDDKDQGIDLPGFMKKHKGLAEALAPAFKRVFPIDKAESEKQTTFDEDDEDSHQNALFSKWHHMTEYLSIPEWKGLIERYIHQNVNFIGCFFETLLIKDRKNEVDRFLALDFTAFPEWEESKNKVFKKYAESDLLSALAYTGQNENWDKSLDENVNTEVLTRVIELPTDHEMINLLDKLAANQSWQARVAPKIGKAFLELEEDDNERRSVFLEQIKNVPLWFDTLENQLPQIFEELTLSYDKSKKGYDTLYDPRYSIAFSFVEVVPKLAEKWSSLWEESDKKHYSLHKNNTIASPQKTASTNRRNVAPPRPR